MRNLIAQQEIPLGDPLRGEGPLGLEGRGAEEAPGIFNEFISGAIGIMTIVAALWFTFLLLGGAYGIMSSGGDKAAAEAARKRISSGLVGLVIVIAAVFLLELIGTLIGFDLILNPAEFVTEFSLNPGQ